MVDRGDPVQPIIWLLLFGALFDKVVDIPGFTSDNYLTFLAPGVVVMTALFGAGWAGMPVIEDLDRGVMDRFLITPVRRGSLIAGRVLQGSLSILIQSIIIVGLALVVGATFPGGIEGVLALFVLAILIGASFGALSIGLAADRPPRGDADRDRHRGHAPADVPLGGVHAEGPHAGLDADRGRLQPGQLGRRGRPRGGLGDHQLGLRGLARGLPVPARAGVRGVRDTERSGPTRSPSRGTRVSP